MKPFTRAERVGKLIQETLSDLLLKQINDPRLEMTIITEVRMSSDLKFAKIFFSTSEYGQKREQVAQGFQSAMGYIRRELARKLELRYMPVLKFCYDESFDYSARIEELLRSEKNEA